MDSKFLKFSRWKNSGYRTREKGFTRIYKGYGWEIFRVDELQGLRQLISPFSVHWANQKYFINSFFWKNYRSKVTLYLAFDLTFFEENDELDLFTIIQSRQAPKIDLIRIDIVKKNKAIIHDREGNKIKYWPMLKQFGSFLDHKPLDY